MLRFPRRPALLLLPALLAGGLVGGVAQQPAAAIERHAVSPTGSVELVGRGFGHGRGMSQWGAFRAGQLGVSARAITDRYYRGSTLTTLADKALSVRLEASVGDALTMVKAASGLVARDESNGAQVAIGTKEYPNATRWRVKAGASTMQVQWATASSATWTPVAVGGRFDLPGTVLLHAPSYTIAVDDEDGGSKAYRGNLRVVRVAASKVAAVNLVQVEAYLRSVVPAESPSSWPATSLQAQAIAARSYAQWHTANPRGSYYQICDTISCQVYAGTTAERTSTDAAVSATANQVRAIGGKAVRTEFSSSNGGWSVTGSAGHSTAFRDNWTAGTWDPSFEWTATIPSSTVASRLLGAGTSLTRLELMSRSGIGDWGGRVASVRLTGTGAGGAAVTRTVTGDAFRSALGLRSTLFKQKTSSELRWVGSASLATETTARSHTFGPSAGRPLMGDWNGDGIDTPAVLDVVGGAWRWRLINSNEISTVAAEFRYGAQSCTPVAGDWDGDGDDTPGVVCGYSGGWRWLLRDTLSTGGPTRDIRYGTVSRDTPVTGAWSTGATAIGITRVVDGQLQWHLRPTPTAGAAMTPFFYGFAGATPVVGDWDGNGIEGIGVATPNGGRWVWELRNNITSGGVSYRFWNGLTDQRPVAGVLTGTAARPVLVG